MSELIIEDYQRKIQEEEAEFTRNLTNLIKIHEEKIKDLVRERNWKLSNLSKQNAIINTDPLESDEGILTYSPPVSNALTDFTIVDDDVTSVSNALTDFTIIDDDVTSISQTNSTIDNALPPRAEPIRIDNALPPRAEPISNEKKMPNYQRMSIPELKVEVAKYGIRPSGKETMIRQLEIIWNKTHENEDDEDDIDKETHNQANNSNETYEDSDDNNASTNISLTEELYKFIKGNRQLYCRVLRYEVLEFDQLLNEINNAGIVCTDRQLQLFLDNKGIIHSSNTKSKQWRQKKDRSKKKNVSNITSIS
ncbi:structure-specific endonuclease subunit slx4-like [Gigaspora margarita]|uniref:Structure-specific endonuclease subunit SLX4 n=1 Tax=Gigaspora margarita TaxID=4874 RepID=A0A8H4EII3_GIGMA|nr:structure-specific endonuclease subunit slx4-like [Gigaspora margarita]